MISCHCVCVCECLEMKVFQLESKLKRRKQEEEGKGKIVRETESSSSPRCQKQSESEPCSCKTVIPRRKHQQWPHNWTRVACHARYTVTAQQRPAFFSGAVSVKIVDMHSPERQTQHMPAFSQRPKRRIFPYLRNWFHSFWASEKENIMSAILKMQDMKKKKQRNWICE